jgi:hypothetical protein
MLKYFFLSWNLQNKIKFQQWNVELVMVLWYAQIPMASETSHSFK